MKIKVVFFFFLLSNLFFGSVSAKPTLTIINHQVRPAAINFAEGEPSQVEITAKIRIEELKAKKGSRWLQVQTTIHNQKGKPICRLKKRVAVGQGIIEVSQQWDGRDKRGKPVTQGSYSYRITARLGRWRSQAAWGKIKVLAGPQPAELNITQTSATPNPFSPDGDGINDSTELKATITITGFDRYYKGKKKLPLIWRLVIRDSHGRPVRFYAGIRKVTNNSEIEISRVWDGSRFGRKVVKDGSYTYTFNARLLKVRATPQGGEITVQTQGKLSLKVTPDFWHIGEIAPGTTITMQEEQKLSVLNDGSATATYSLGVLNPEGWEISQTDVGPETYILNAAFSEDVNNISWNQTNHALSTQAVRCTETKFAGDQTGEKVAAGQQRTLWLQFKAPTATMLTKEQTIKVIITAESP
jgi:hypothetical protein